MFNGEGAELVTSTPITVDGSGEGEFEIKLETGYKVDNVKVTDGQGSASFDSTNQKVTLSSVTSNITVIVTVQPIEYKVTVKISGQGSVKCDTVNIQNDESIFVQYGKTIDLDINAATGWKIESVTNATKGSDNTYTVGPVKGDTDVTVVFVEKPSVTKIKVDTDSIRTEYNCGEQLDLSNMKITVYYSNYTEKTVVVNSNDIRVEHLGSNVYNSNDFRPGYWTAKFNITYLKHTDTVTVYVNCHKLNGLYTSMYCDACKAWDGTKHCTISHDRLAQECKPC